MKATVGQCADCGKADCVVQISNELGDTTCQDCWPHKDVDFSTGELISMIGWAQRAAQRELEKRRPPT